MLRCDQRATQAYGATVTLLQLHLGDVRHRYRAAHVKGMEALSVGELERFAEAISEERAILEEWVSALQNYVEHHLKRRPRGVERLSPHAASDSARSRRTALSSLSLHARHSA